MNKKLNLSQRNEGNFTYGDLMKNKKLRKGSKRIVIQAREISYRKGKQVVGKSKSITVHVPLDKVWKKLIRALKDEPDVGYEIKPAKVRKR